MGRKGNTDMAEFKLKKDDKMALPIFMALGAILGSLFRRSIFGLLAGVVGYFIWKNVPEKNAHVKEQPPTP
jgi:hypothetical protein